MHCYYSLYVIYLLLRLSFLNVHVCINTFYFFIHWCEATNSMLHLGKIFVCVCVCVCFMSCLVFQSVPMLHANVFQCKTMSIICCQYQSNTLSFALQCHQRVIVCSELAFLSRSSPLLTSMLPLLTTSFSPSDSQPQTSVQQRVK